MDAPDVRSPLCGDEACVGSFAGGGVNADVVFEIDPGSEGGVEFVEGGEPGALGFGLEIIFDDLVDRFNFAFTVRLVGLVVEFGRCELRENPCKLLGDIDRTVIQVDFTRYAPAKDEALECVLHAGELFVEVVAAGKDLARVVVDPDEEVGLFRACYRGEPDSVACVAYPRASPWTRSRGRAAWKRWKDMRPSSARRWWRSVWVMPCSPRKR